MASRVRADLKVRAARPVAGRCGRFALLFCSGDKKMLVIGLMNGTSADGIDAALVRVKGASPRWQARLLAFHCERLDPRVRAAILRVANVGHTTTAEISNLNFLIGELFARAALRLCRKARVSPRQVDLIGSHGQTVYHQGRPAPFLTARQHTSTLQIGEPAIVAERTGIPVMADFRVADVAAGGQGAPLVPFVDYVLFAHPAMARVALNIGGIANVTVIPPAARREHLLAFDTGPGNMIVDALAAHFTGGRESIDRDARRARRGRTDPALLQDLLDDTYFALAPPKSAGREQYGAPFVEKLLARAAKRRVAPDDLMRTATLLTPLSIVDAYHRFMLPHLRRHGLKRNGKVQLIVAGGGAHNPLMRAQLAAGLPGVEMKRSAELGVPEDAKEAYAFALLAYESWHRRPANLPSATGARHPALLGKLCLPWGRRGSG
jgi:anhydro-N-acetylmuramic acid kinase